MIAELVLMIIKKMLTFVNVILYFWFEFKNYFMKLKNYSTNPFEELNLTISKKIKYLIFLSLFFGFSSVSQLNAATLYFNTVYKASGTNYNTNTQSLTSVSLVSGSSFNFTSAIPSATTFNSGNNENGILSYVDSSGQLISIYGIISRQNKSGNTTLGVNFITTNSSYTVSSSSEAYVLVVPGQESAYTVGTNVSTSSDPIDPVLNAILATQGSSPIMTINNPSVLENAGYITFTISLSNTANASISFTPSLSDVSALLNSDYTNSLQYYNISNSTWTNVSSTVTIPQGTTSIDVRVPILDDSNSESTETFNFKTGAITGGNVLNNYGVTGIGTINDNDTTPLSATTSQNNVSCYSGSNGTATVAPSGGTAPYTYSWKNASNTVIGTNNVTVTGLSSGDYTCTITDNNSTSITKNFTITQPTAISVTPNSQTNVACFGGSNGAASINTPTGGAGGYTYDWTPGTPTGDGTTSIEGLTAQTYTCTVTDANGCTRTQNFTITQPTAAVSGSTVITNVACNGGTTGAINLTPTGGTGPYTFNWGGGITTEDRTGLAA
ncbi:hypothetical protein EOD40_05735, partial [Flavobacterium sufflavum]